jgi:Lrp/AsnC family transcriptional regulator for asnA, asnC and gidA
MLEKNPNVFGVYDVTGEYDMFVSVSFKSMEDMNEFNTKELKDPKITRSVTFVILKTKKESHTFL